MVDPLMEGYGDTRKVTKAWLLPQALLGFVEIGCGCNVIGMWHMDFRGLAWPVCFSAGMSQQTEREKGEEAQLKGS